MGHTLHHTIVVTSWSGPDLFRAARKARLMGCAVIGPSAPQMNGYRTFCIVPDGSKDGWGTSDAGDTRRNQFVDWLNAQRDEDGGTCFDWFEASFGNPDENAEVSRCERRMAPGVINLDVGERRTDMLIDAVLRGSWAVADRKGEIEGEQATDDAV